MHMLRLGLSISFVNKKFILVLLFLLLLVSTISEGRLGGEFPGWQYVCVIC